MNLDKIEKLVKIIENSSMLDFSIQEGDVKIKMSRRGSVGAPAAPMSVSTQGVDSAADGLDSEDEAYITSPIVGTFYSAPSPDAKAGWSSRSIYRILANECYTGKIVQGKTRTVSYKNQARIQIPPEEWIRIAHVHEPIISEEMFFFVQEKKHRRFTE